MENGKVLISGNGNWKSYINSGLVDLIKAKQNIIFIGISGGLQIFFSNSEEDLGEGASIFRGKVIKLTSQIPKIDYLKVSNFGEMYFANSYGIKYDNNFSKEISYSEFYEYDNKRYIASLKHKNFIGIFLMVFKIE